MYFVTSFRSAYYRDRVCSMMLCAVVNGGNMVAGCSRSVAQPQQVDFKQLLCDVLQMLYASKNVSHLWWVSRWPTAAA